MTTSAVSLEKPMPHINFSDWTSGLQELQQSSNEKIQHAYHLRHSARQLQIESRVKTEWETYHNDNRLADRVQELLKWRTNYQELLAQVEQELRALTAEKAVTDIELESLNIFIQVTSDCLGSRDARKATELTSDLANDELKKELVIEDLNKAMLSEYCQMSWEKINELEKLKFYLILEINNKTEAIDIDYNQMAMSKDSADISFKPDPMKIIKGSISYQQWLDKQKHFLSEGEKELRNALGSREQLFMARGRAKNTMKAQIDATEYALRRRIYETKRAHSELTWQKGKMLDNMAKLVAEMAALQASILSKTNGLKLAQTRLENRCYRPASELALDAADEGIKREVKSGQATLKTLNAKYDSAKAAYNSLETQCMKITTDLEDKTETMDIDERALKIRDAAKASIEQNQVDRSIELVNFQGRIPAS